MEIRLSGRDRLDLALGGIRLRARPLPAGPLEGILRERYEAFCAPRRGAGPSVSIRISWRRRPLPGPETPEVRESGAGFEIRSDRVLARFRKTGGRWRGVAEVEETPYAFDTLLRVAWTRILLDAGGLLVHACGILAGGRAYLFPGRSGAGKTTLARKADAPSVLSDEIVCVRAGARGFRAHGTPFFGEFARGGRRVSAPLAGVCFLERGRAGLRPIRKPDALVRLLGTVLFFSKDRGPLDRVLAVSAELIRRVPAAILSFGLAEPYDRILRRICAA